LCTGTARDFGSIGAGAQPMIDRIFAFDEIRDAHRYVEAGGQVGKIVVTI